MNPSPYRSADDRFPYLAHLKVGNAEFDFMMVSERSEGWYGKGEDHHDYMGLIKPGDAVVDIGANEGYTSLLAAVKTGSEGLVECFEPAAHNWGPLLINMALNRNLNINAHQVAVSDKSGKINFNGEASLSGAGVVDAAALDDFPLWVVDVLKLDVEGFEIKALRGAVKTIAKFRPNILVELHLDRPTGADMRTYGDNPEELLAFAKEHNYSILRDGQPITELTSGVVVMKPL